MIPIMTARIFPILAALFESSFSPIPYDEDALDYISSFYENVKRQPDKYKTLGTGLDV